MPLVDYQCPRCGEKMFDVLVKRTDEPMSCPRCDTPMMKQPPLSNWAFNRKEKRWDA